MKPRPRVGWPLFGAFALGAGLAGALVRCGDDSTDVDASSDVAIQPLAMTLDPSEAWVKPGATIAVTVGLARGPGGEGDVVVTVESDAGAAVTADPLTIPATNVTGTLTLHVAPAFSQGDAVLTVDGAGLAQAPFAVHVRGASGAPDTSFGSGGVADLTPGSGTDLARAMVALQSGVLVGGTHVETDDAGQTTSMKVLQLTSGGAVDGSFAPTSAPGELFSLARMPDGRVYAAGTLRAPKADFSAVRVLAGGGLDPTYSVVTPITLGDDVARAAVVEPGGALVLAGPVGDASAVGLARYTQAPLPAPDAGNDSGDAGDDAADADDAPSDAAIDKVTSRLDPAFGDGGVVVTPLAKPGAGATAMLVAPDGSLYVLGYQTDSSTDVAWLHYDTTGTLAKSATVPLTTGTYGAAAALLQPDGAVVVASDDNGQSLALRLLPTGAPDPAFGALGFAAFAVGPSSGARAVALDPASGALYVGGFTGTPHQCYVARLSPAGGLDKAFATNGVLSLSEGDACDVAAVAVDDDGNVLVLETVTSSGKTHMAVARYWP